MRRNHIADNTSNRSGRQQWGENDQYRQPSNESTQRNYGQRSQQDYNSEYRGYRTGNEYNDNMWREPQRGQNRQQDSANDWRQEDRYNDYDNSRVSGGRSGYQQEYNRGNDWNQQQGSYESRRGNYGSQDNYGNQGNQRDYSNDWNNSGRYNTSGNYSRQGQDYERNINNGQTNYGNAQGGNYGSERYGNSNNYSGQQQQGSYGNDWSSNRYDQQDQGIHRGKGPKGYQRSGERIREDISDRLSDDGMLDASDIEVKMEGNEVILSGTVENREAKRRAEEIAESISGVTNVENRLKLHHNGSETTDSSSQTPGSATMRTGSSEANASDTSNAADKNKNKAS